MDHPPFPPYLTLTEAAQALTARLGQQWTGKHVLGCASRGEISVYARIAHAVRLVRVAPIDGEPNEIIGEAGSLPRISAKAVQALLLSDVADFKELTYTRSVDFFGKPEKTSVTEWTLAPGETAPTISPDACRVSREGVEQLLSLYGQSKQANTQPAPAVVVPEPAQKSDKLRRLEALRALGGDVRGFKGKWSVTGIGLLVKQEKDEGRDRRSEKTIRADLQEAAEAEKREGNSDGKSTAWHP